MLNEDGTQETPEQENVRLQAAKRIEDAAIEADRLSQLAERPKTPDEWVHRQFPGQPRYAITPPNTYEIDSFATGYRHADDPYHCPELDAAWAEANRIQGEKYEASIHPVPPATIAAAAIVVMPIKADNAAPIIPTVTYVENHTVAAPVAACESCGHSMRSHSPAGCSTCGLLGNICPTYSAAASKPQPAPVAPPVTPPAATIPSTTATHVPLSALFDVITFAEAHPEAVSAVVGLFKGLFGHGKAA